MPLPRKTFSNRYADLDFGMKMPIGFFEEPLPTESPDFGQLLTPGT
jgi:hypothetical protein